MKASYRLPACLVLCLLVFTGAARADAQQPALVARMGGTLSAMGIAASPDGKWFASEGQDSSITIWSTEDGTEYRTFQPLTAYAQFASPGHIAVASDAATLVVLAGSDLHLIDVKTATETHRYPLKSGAWSAWQIAANPRRMAIAVIDQQGSVSVLSLEDGHELFHATVQATYTGKVPVLQMRFSPDGNLLAIASDYELQLWNWATNRKLLDLDSHAFHANDLPRAVTVQSGNTTQPSTAEKEHYDWFTGISFSPDGKHLALTSHDELSILKVPSGAREKFTKIDSSMTPGCIFATNDLVFLPDLNLGISFFSLKKGLLGNVPNANLQDYVAVPGMDRGILLSGVPYLVTASKLSVVNALFAKARPPVSLIFTPDGSQLFVSTFFKPFASWSLDSGEADAIPDSSQITLPAMSNNGKFLAAADLSGVGIFTLTGNQNRFRIPVKIHSINPSVSLSADGTLLGMAQASGQVDLLSVPQKKSIATLTADHPTQIAVEPDGARFAVADRSGTTVYSASSPPAKIASLPIDDPQNLFKNTPPNVLRFSPDGKWLAIMEVAEVRLVSTQSWTAVRKIGGASGLCVAFSPDSRSIALTMQSQGIEVVDVESGKVLFQDNKHSSFCPIAFSADGKVIAASSQYGTELLSATTGQELATLYLYSDETHLDKQQLDWLVVSPNGLFDGTPGAWTQLGWRFSNNTFDVSPVEIFFQNFYHPGLLAEIIAGKTPEAPASIADIDRRQPEVRLTSSSNNASGSDNTAPVTTRTVSLELAVSEAAPDEAHRSGSGARDLRLFRNGTLVKAWHSDIKLDASGKAEIAVEVPIVAGENRFTAYAFNDANIKSADATLAITGDDSLHRGGIAWVISMGINQYAAATPENHLALNFAEGDAKDFASQFTKAQAQLVQFAQVKRIDLLGANATKANLQMAFRLLAGGSQVSLNSSQQQLFSGVAQVQPEDGVFLFYAGHGTAFDGHFYFIPQDFNPDVAVNDPRANTVSDLDLSQMLEGIAPSRSFLIIDACNSGQAIDSTTPVGPMNASGLAQLAYEKGLFILAASKDSEPALEAHELGSGHGFLTYALVDEGLKAGDAAEDGVVELRPWFIYAGRRVPELQAAHLEQRGIEAIGSTPESDARQHPRIFYRREAETNPFIVARTAAAATPAQ